jgi:PRC-barrel domain
MGANDALGSSVPNANDTIPSFYKQRAFVSAVAMKKNTHRTVVNEANETVGTIDDLIVTPSEKVPFAVLSVGGFLGMGTKYVVVPFSSLQVHDKKMVLPGATKDSLKALPEFKYAD